MRCRALDIPGVWLIEPEMVVDSRGTFRRHFCAETFAAHGMTATIAQGNISENPRSGTLRGFHYRPAPFHEAKTLSCLSGAIHDVVVDCRPDSPTFMRWVALDLSVADRMSLHVPAGCANAWLTTAADTVVHYYMSEAYVPGADTGFRYDDPAFGVRWPAPPEVISDRDLGFPDFDPTSLSGR